MKNGGPIIARNSTYVNKDGNFIIIHPDGERTPVSEDDIEASYTFLEEMPK